MGRLKINERGVSLVELVVATVLLAVVILSASNLMVNFGNFTSDLVSSETSLMGTALGTLEEMVRRINASNQVTTPVTGLGAASIAIRVDDAVSPPTPSNYTDDTVYTYWLDLAEPDANGHYPIKYKKKVGIAAEGATTTIARDVYSLSFTKDPTDLNKIEIVLEARVTSGATSSGAATEGFKKEKLETTAVMRSRSANLP